MVNEAPISILLNAGHILLAAGTETASLLPVAEPVIKRLDGPRRAMALAALAGLVILGFALVLLTWLGARYVRRLMGGKPRSVTPRPDDWATKPLSPGESPKDSLKEP